jgi:MinD superfamily P-loop ATPase
MKKIAITGGKGGTGKSTVAVLSASRLAEKHKVLLVDLDVECPNDYLLVNAKLDRPWLFTKSYLPKIDVAKCTRCGKCVKACTSQALFMPPHKVPFLIPELCSACQVCVDVCPAGAIKTFPEKTGRIFYHQLSENLGLVTGQANTDIIETASIVRQTKAAALDKARAENFEYVIFDTAAGTHCPVVVALLDVDLAWAVTEPTPMGAHDLDLILQLLKKLKIKTKVLLNQSDLGDTNSIAAILQKFDRPTWDQELPHSPALAKVYGQGQLLASGLPKIQIL